MIHWAQNRLSTEQIREGARELSNTISNVIGANGGVGTEDTAKSVATTYLFSAAEYIEALERSGDPVIVTLQSVTTEDGPELYGLDVLGKLWVYLWADDKDKKRLPGWIPLACGRGTLHLGAGGDKSDTVNRERGRIHNAALDS